MTGGHMTKPRRVAGALCVCLRLLPQGNDCLYGESAAGPPCPRVGLFLGGLVSGGPDLENQGAGGSGGGDRVGAHFDHSLLPLGREADKLGGRVGVPLNGGVGGGVVGGGAVVLVDQDPGLSGLRDVRDDAHGLRAAVLMDALGDSGAGGRGQEGQNGGEDGDPDVGDEGSKHDLGPSLICSLCVVPLV